MIHGLANGIWLDDKRMWPIFARAEKLDVPIYLHPSMPQQPVIDSYYKEYAARLSDLPARRLGLHARDRDAGGAARALRRVRRASEPQDHPRPSRRGRAVPAIGASTMRSCARRRIRFRSPTSSASTSMSPPRGFFSDTALLCSVMELGVDRIMFSVDYPFEAQPPAPRWLANIPLCDEDKAKIASGNAKRLLKL